MKLGGDHHRRGGMAAETPTWIFMVGGRWDRCSGLEEDVEKEKQAGQGRKTRRGEVG